MTHDWLHTFSANPFDPGLTLGLAAVGLAGWFLSLSLRRWWHIWRGQREFQVQRRQQLDAVMRVSTRRPS